MASTIHDGIDSVLVIKRHSPRTMGIRPYLFIWGCGEGVLSKANQDVLVLGWSIG
jgi:hypothetical protein